MQITVSTVVAAPIAAVWAAYNAPEAIKVWNTASPDWHTTASTVDLRVGGQFSSRMEAKDGSFGFDFAGEYTKVEAPHLLEYRFGERTGQVEFADGPAVVGHAKVGAAGTGQVEFADGPAGVTVTVTFDAEDTYPVEQQRTGWQAILDSFARYVVAAKG